MSEIINAEIEWLDDGTPYSNQFDDIYFSSQGGPAESEHVFINGNNLETRWREHRHSDPPFFIAELGFGTGLNYLLCWQLLDRLSIHGLRLHYLAFEQHPLSVEDLHTAQAKWPELEQYSTRLQKVAIDHTAGLHRLCLDDNVTLDLYFGDALKGMRELFPECAGTVDCWFMDGFAPARNPALWDDSIIELIWQQSRVGTTLSTYSVAGKVRRSLKNAGFEVERLPGYGSKREMLRAFRTSNARPVQFKAESKNKPRDAQSAADRAPWYRISKTKTRRKEAAIIGAGLAGCSTAFSLARKGWQVTLVEAAPGTANGASGNHQGVLQPRLTAEKSVHAQFYLHALLYANRQFGQLQQIRDIGWHADGIIRLPDSNRTGLRKLLNSPEDFYSHKVLTALTAQQASDLAGLPLTGDALFLSYGGWIRPAELCQSYLDSIADGQLQLIKQQAVTSLNPVHDQWQLLTDNNIIHQAPVVILCNSHSAGSYAQTHFLPLIPVRGQLTSSPCNSTSSRLLRAVVAEKYICPADNNSHSIGASYQNKVTDTSISTEENRENLQGIHSAFASPDKLMLTADGARASVRCNSADYFPVIGAAPDYQNFIKVYSALKRNAGAQMSQSANYHPGLFVNSAHGSYGLASCPLGAEYLASLINNENLPLTRTMADSLSPARFIIRELKKQRV